MIIIRFAVLYTMQIIIQNSICLNVIDLPPDVYNAKRQIQNKISLRASEMDVSPPQKLSTSSPTLSQTMSPSESPTMSPTLSQTISPSESPTMSPTLSQTMSPSESPTMSPTTSLTTSTSPTTSLTTIPPKAAISNLRRYWLINEKPANEIYLKSSDKAYEDEKDVTLKSKISMLVNQTMQDAHRKMQDIESIKERHRDEKPYRAGFVLSLIKKSRDVLNELFNVAVKHREEWKALEQLKIFELIVHTNVDTTNLLRQLVDIHLGSSNSSVPDSSKKDRRG